MYRSAVLGLTEAKPRYRLSFIQSGGCSGFGQSSSVGAGGTDMRETLRKASGAVMALKEGRLERSLSVRPSKEMGFYSPVA